MVMNSRVGRKMVPCEPIDQYGTYKGLLQQPGVVPQRGVQFLESGWHSRVPCDSLRLVREHCRSYWSVPDLFQGHALLEIGHDLLHQDAARHGLLKRLRHSDLVGVIHTLDGFLSLDPIFEREVAGEGLAGQIKPGEETEGESETQPLAQEVHPTEAVEWAVGRRRG